MKNSIEIVCINCILKNELNKKKSLIKIKLLQKGELFRSFAERKKFKIN